MKRTIKLIIRNIIVYALAFVMCFESAITDETISVLQESLSSISSAITTYASTGSPQASIPVGSPSSASGGIISNPCYAYPAIKLSIIYDDNTSLAVSSGMDAFFAYWGNKYPVTTSESNMVQGSFFAMSHKSSFNARGANDSNIHYYSYEGNSIIDNGLAPITWVSDGDPEAVSSYSAGVNRSSIKAASKSDLASNWKTIANANRNKAMAAWAAIVGIKGTGGQGSVTSINVSGNFDTIYGSVETNSSSGTNLTSDQETSLWYGLLDALMSLWSIAPDSQKADWETAVEKCINGENVAILAEIAPAMVFNAKTANEYFGVVTAIDYISFCTGVTANNLINGKTWYSTNKGSSVSGTGNARLQSALGLSINSSITEAPNKDRYPATGHYETNAWSWGLTAVVQPRPTIKNNAIKWETSSTVPTNFISRLGVTDGGSSQWMAGYTLLGIGGAAAVSSDNFGLLSATPDNYASSSLGFESNVTLTLYGGASEEDLSPWQSKIDAAKSSGSNFKIVINWSLADEDYNKIYTYNTTTKLYDTHFKTHADKDKTIVSNPTTIIFSPDEMTEWITGRKAIIAYDAISDYGMTEGGATLTYKASIQVSLVNDSSTVITSTATDTASFIGYEERIGYASTPQAFTEFKNYGTGSNISKQTITEDFEAMAGVPSTEQMYFAAGGSEFIVDISLNETADETAFRTYDYYFTQVDCEYKNADSLHGMSSAGSNTYSGVGTHGGTSTESYKATAPVGNVAGESNITINSHDSDSTITAVWRGTIANNTADPGWSTLWQSDTYEQSGDCPNMQVGGHEGTLGVLNTPSANWDVSSFNTALKQAQTWAKAYEDTNTTYTYQKDAASDNQIRQWQIGNATITVEITGGTNSKNNLFSGAGNATSKNGSYTSSSITNATLTGTSASMMGSGYGYYEGTVGTASVAPAGGCEHNCTKEWDVEPQDEKKDKYGNITQEKVDGVAHTHNHTDQQFQHEAAKSSEIEKSADYTYKITVTFSNGTLKAHQLCGPCCQHVLPETHDTWTQTAQYDSMEINNIHVWRIDQAAIEGMSDILDIKYVSADISSGNPTIYYNIALKNDSTYKSITKVGNGGYTKTAKVGRIVYSFETGYMDQVSVNIGARDNTCDGLAVTASTNVKPNGGAGHAYTWASGFIYAGSNNSYNTSRTGNTKNGETGYIINPRNKINGNAETSAGLSKDWFNTTLTTAASSTTAVDINKITNTKEYKEFKKRRDTTMHATMVTDFLILQTTSGDQSVMYYTQQSGNGAADAEIQNIDASGETRNHAVTSTSPTNLIDGSEGKTILAAVNSTITYLSRADLMKYAGAHLNTVDQLSDSTYTSTGSKIIASAIGGGTIANRYWYNNSNSASSWGPYEINIGGYTGRYWYGSNGNSTTGVSKFTGTGNGATVSTIFDNLNMQNSSMIMKSRPVKATNNSKGLWLCTGELNLKLDLENNQYQTGYSEVFFSNQLHWANRNLKRTNYRRSQIISYYQTDAYKTKDYEGLAKLNTKEYAFTGQNKNGAAYFYYASNEYVKTGYVGTKYHDNEFANYGDVLTGDKSTKDSYQLDIEDYRIAAGLRMEAVYSNSTVGGSNYTKCNDIVIQDPVSTEDIALVSLPTYRDQRTEDTVGGAADMMDAIETAKTCPGTPELCEYRTLNCTYLEDKIVFSTDFTPDKSGNFVNKITGNSLKLQSGFTLVKNANIDGNSNNYVLNAAGTRISIPFSEMELSYSPSTEIQVDADIIVSPSTKNQMIFSFNQFDLYLPGTTENSNTKNIFLTLNTGVGWERKINTPVADGKKHHISVLFSFSSIDKCKVFIDGKETTYTRIKNSNTLQQSYIGSTLNIGSWGVNDNYGANFVMDNLVVKRLAGSTSHSDSCYTVQITHTGNNTHVHTSDCLDLTTKLGSYTLSQMLDNPWAYASTLKKYLGEEVYNYIIQDYTLQDIYSFNSTNGFNGFVQVGSSTVTKSDGLYTMNSNSWWECKARVNIEPKAISRVIIEYKGNRPVDASGNVTTTGIGFSYSDNASAPEAGTAWTSNYVKTTDGYKCTLDISGLDYSKTIKEIWFDLGAGASTGNITLKSVTIQGFGKATYSTETAKYTAGLKQNLFTGLSTYDTYSQETKLNVTSGSGSIALDTSSYYLVQMYGAQGGGSSTYKGGTGGYTNVIFKPSQSTYYYSVGKQGSQNGNSTWVTRTSTSTSGGAGGPGAYDGGGLTYLATSSKSISSGTTKTTTGSKTTYSDSKTYTSNSTFTAPYTGYYTLTAYGAEGGAAYDREPGDGPSLLSAGGKGGFISAKVYLTAGTKVTITVGTKGALKYSYGDQWHSGATGETGGSTTLSFGSGYVVAYGGGGGSFRGWACAGCDEYNHDDWGAHTEVYTATPGSYASSGVSSVTSCGSGMYSGNGSASISYSITVDTYKEVITTTGSGDNSGLVIVAGGGGGAGTSGSGGNATASVTSAGSTQISSSYGQSAAKDSSLNGGGGGAGYYGGKAGSSATGGGYGGSGYVSSSLTKASSYGVTDTYPNGKWTSNNSATTSTHTGNGSLVIYKLSYSTASTTYNSSSTYEKTTIVKIKAVDTTAQIKELVMRYYTLIPDKVDGKTNPVWKCGGSPYNYHVCNSSCKTVKTLTCSEPHHSNTHYDVSNTICWQACGVDSNHQQNDNNVAVSAKEKITVGNFINLDYGFTIYFPNRGKFEDGQQYAIGSLTSARGLGYTNIYETTAPYGKGTNNSSGYVGTAVGMNTTKWTRVKRIKLPVNVIYDPTGDGSHAQLYLAGEWITLGDRGVYNSNWSHVNSGFGVNKTGSDTDTYHSNDTGGIGSAGAYNESNWSNYGTWLYDGIYKEYYNFYCVLANSEAMGAAYTVEVTALNSKDFLSDTSNKDAVATNTTSKNDNPDANTNKLRDTSFRALHGGTNTKYFDVVGRIGNLIMEDVEDFRYSNLFKQALESSESTSSETKTYTIANGLGNKDTAGTSNDKTVVSNSVGIGVETLGSGAFAAVKGASIGNNYYKVTFSGTGLNAGMLEVIDLTTGQAVNSDRIETIQESSSTASYYLDLSQESNSSKSLIDTVNKVDIKFVSRSSTTMVINNCEVVKLGSSPEQWLLDGIVKAVDSTKQNYYFTWIADIRGIKVSNKTNYVNTWGTLDWVNDKYKLLPLSPEKNNISVLQDEPVSVGYSALMDIQTMGNYYENDTTKLQIVPKYYALDLDNNKAYKLDVYMMHDGTYQAINLADNVNKSANSTLTRFKNPNYFSNNINLDWVNEADRRNVSTEELRKTQEVVTASRLGDETTVESAGSLDDTPDRENGQIVTIRPYDMPSGHVNSLGDSQYMELDGNARTFVGGTSTYNTYMNLNERMSYILKNSDGSESVSETEWYKAAQRWHFTVGLPSSAVMVFAGTKVTDEAINAVKDSGYAVVCVLDITAVGEIYSLHYSQLYSGSDIATTTTDYKNIIKGWTDEGTSGSGYMGSIKSATTSGTYSLDKFGDQLDWEPVIMVYSLSDTSTQDVEIVGSH